MEGPRRGMTLMAVVSLIVIVYGELTREVDLHEKRRSGNEIFT
jgi:hypothetical protein